MAKSMSAEDREALFEALKGAKKRSEMVTRYDLKAKGVVVDGSGTEERIEVDRVVVDVDDTGYVQVMVKGYTLTKAGKRRIETPYAYGDFSVVKEVIEMLKDEAF